MFVTIVRTFIANLSGVRRPLLGPWTLYLCAMTMEYWLWFSEAGGEVICDMLCVLWHVLMLCIYFHFLKLVFGYCGGCSGTSWGPCRTTWTLSWHLGDALGQVKRWDDNSWCCKVMDLWKCCCSMGFIVRVEGCVCHSFGLVGGWSFEMWIYHLFYNICLEMR